MAGCHFHQDRSAVGRCIRCEKAICDRCRTGVEGLNYCHACLDRLGRPPRDTASGTRAWILVVGTGLTLLVWLGLGGLFYALQGRLAP